MRRRHLTIYRAFALSVIGLLALMVACFSVADDGPGGNPAVANQAPSPTPEPLREFRVFVEPRDCASYILDPQPEQGSKYIQGTGVTISLVPAEGCRVKEWINVDSFSGLAGRVNMNADRIVQINMVRAQAALSPTAAPTATIGPDIVEEIHTAAKAMFQIHGGDTDGDGVVEASIYHAQ